MSAKYNPLRKRRPEQAASELAATPPPADAPDDGDERDVTQADERSHGWTMGDLLPWAVSVLSAGVAAAIALQHLPWLAITALAIGVAAAGYAATQAVTAGVTAQDARKWWSATAGVFVLIVVGGLLYHYEWDPATRPPGVPVAATVSVDPTSEISPQQCRTIVFRSTPRDLAPPSALSQRGINSWEESRNGADGLQTVVAVVLQGASSTDVVISGIQVVIVSKSAPLRGPAIELGDGCGSELHPRLYSVNLDGQDPAAVFQNGTSFPAVNDGVATAHQAQSPVFKISASDPEYFVVRATTTSHFVRWYLTVTWESEGRSGTLQVMNGPEPFATTSVNPQVNRMVYWRSG